MPTRQVWFIIISFLLFSSLVLLKTMDTSPPVHNNPPNVTSAVVASLSGETSPNTKEIKVSVSMGESEFAVLQQLKTQYEVLHFGTSIQLENVPREEAYTRWKKQAQLGDAPDIMLLDNGWVNEFAALGYLYPVDEFFTTEQQLLQFDPMLTQNKWNGYIWGIPKEIDPYVLVYNKNRIGEWEPKRPPQTADELLVFHKAGTRLKEGKLGLVLPAKDPLAFFTFLWLNGGVTHDPERARSIALNQVVNKRILEAFFTKASDAIEGKTDVKQNESAANKPGSPRMESAYWSLNPWTDLRTGRAAMTLASYSDYRLNNHPDLGWAKLPALKDRASSGGGLKGRSFVLSSRTQLAKEAYDWIREMTGLDAEVKYWNAGGGSPAQLAAYRTDKLQQDPDYKDLVQAIETGIVFPAEPDLPKKLSLTEGQLDMMWKGEESVSVVLERIDKQWSPSKAAMKP
jgi:maltose-binding protein MalE